MATSAIRMPRIASTVSRHPATLIVHPASGSRPRRVKINPPTLVTDSSSITTS
jgi:hypothetical protein